MNYKKKDISRFGYFGRKNRVHVFLKWLCMSLILLLFYSLMCSGAFKTAQPILIIPLSIAGAMHGREIGGAIFGVFCGFAIDLACGNLFGMTSVWLMPCCLITTLLVMHLIRVNFVNHLWISTLTCLILAFMDFFFNYLIWDKPNSLITLTSYILPSYISAVALSPAVYFLVKRVNIKFLEKDNPMLEEKNDDESE